MAEAGEDGGAKVAKPKSKKKLMLIAGGAAVVILGGGGAYVALAGGEKAEEHAKADAHGAGGHGEAPAAGAGAHAKAAAFVELPEMIVNLAAPNPDKQQYVRMTVALEVANAQLVEAIKPLMPRVLDSFQTHLREMRPADLRGSAGAYRLKEELLRRVNVAIAPAKADAVLFKDLVVQ